MKFLVPKSYTYIDQPIYIEGDRYWIENIVVSPQYNVIIAKCKQTQPNKEAVIPFNHEQGGVKAKMEYFRTKYEVGSYFIEFDSGWLAIIGAELYKDDNGYWKVEYSTKDYMGFLCIYSEEELHKMESDGKIKFGFVDHKQIKKTGVDLDDVMKMYEFCINEVTDTDDTNLSIEI